MKIHTQHGRHDSHTRVLLILIWPTDAQVVDGIQTDRVEPGRDGALGSHGRGRGRANDAQKTWKIRTVKK